MKPIARVLVLPALLALALAPAAAADQWFTDFEEAKTAAVERRVPILILFTGSDWCGWCMKLDREVLSEQVFQDFADERVVLFKADFPYYTEQAPRIAKQNEALSKNYGIRGFPSVVIVDHRGNEIARTGYRSGGAEAYVAHLKELLSSVGAE